MIAFPAIWQHAPTLWEAAGFLASAAIAGLALRQASAPRRGKNSEIQSLQRIASMVNRSLDLRAVLGAALDELVVGMGMDAGVFRVYARNEDQQPMLVWRGIVLERLSETEMERQEGGSLGRGNSHGGIRTLEVASCRDNDPLLVALRAGGMSFLAIYPVLAGNEALGAVALASRNARRTDELREDFVRALTEVVGVACSQASQKAHSERLAGNLITLQEINKIISKSFELNEIISRIVTEGKRLLQSGECHLFLLDPRSRRLAGSASTQGNGLDITGLGWDLSSPSAAIQALHERRVVAVGGHESGGAPAVPWASALFVPLVAKDEEVGVLAFTHDPGKHEFSAEEISRAESLAHQASIALENARLFHIISRSQKEWETTFDAMQDNVSLHDLSGRVLRANLALARRLKTTPAGIIGRMCSNLYGRGDAGAHGCAHLAPLERDRLVVEEIEMPEVEGVFQLSVSPWYDKNNRLVGSIHVAKDISRERLLQQQLIQSEKLSAIGELISGIAHELNNPLTGVMGFSQLLQLRKDLDERVRESLLKINNLALRCKKIVDNLLSFARKQKPERKLCDINDILERTIELRSYELLVNNIEIRRDLDRRLPKTIADGHQLQAVFLNIVTNAEQALLEAGGRGCLTIRTRADLSANTLMAEIEDDGPGIPEAHLNRIFDPFFTTKEVGKGTGLGLSLSYGIVKEHGGNIFARNKGGRGAIFTVELPIIMQVPEEKDLTRGLVPRTDEFERLIRGKRILVVDDENYLLDFFREALGFYPAEVDTADDGALALGKLKRRDYDVIVTDFKMPNMSGRELYEWVREHRPAMLRRMIFVTGDTVSNDTRSFFEGIQARYLAKPFRIDEVREIIRATLAECPDAGQAVNTSLSEPVR